MIAAATAFSQNPAAEAQQAQQALASGNFNQAIDIYSRLSAAFPENTALKRNLGLALHSAERYSDALHCFLLVLENDPHDKAALLFSGIELGSLHEPDKAIANLTRFLEQDNKTATGFLARGRIFLSLDNFNSALEDFLKAATLEPQNARAWEGLGRTYLLAAQRAFEAVEEHGAFSAEWYALRARTYLGQRDYKAAFRLFHDAEARAPDLPGVHAGLAELYRQTNHPDWATTESAKEAQASPVASSDLRRKYLDALNFQQRSTEALTRLAPYRDASEYHALLGLAYRIQHRDLESVEEFRRALALSPKSAILKLELATSLTVANDCNAAIPVVESILKTDLNSPEANHVMGECLVHEKRPQEAISYLKAALKQDPQLLPAESALGRAYFHSGDYRAAVIHLRKVIGLGDPSIMYQLSQAYRKLGDQKASADYLTQYKTRLDQMRQASPGPVGEITPP